MVCCDFIGMGNSGTLSRGNGVTYKKWEEEAELLEWYSRIMRIPFIPVAL